MNVKVTWQLLRDLLLEYVEDDSISRPTPTFLNALSSITINESANHEECAYDTHILSFILSRALRLEILEYSCEKGINLDSAFTRQMIGARLTDLCLSGTKITDATIDVLCQQPGQSLCYLGLERCEFITEQGDSLSTKITNFEHQTYNITYRNCKKRYQKTRILRSFRW